MQALILIGAGLLAAGFTFTVNWLALIPWRRAKDQHWTERARLFHPVRIAAASNLWVLPAVLTMSARLLWPERSPHWMLMVLATAVGAILGTVPMDHEVFPRIPLNELMHMVAAGWLVRFAMWFVFLSAIVLSPDEFNFWSIAIAGVLLALLIFWIGKGWIGTGRKLGLFVPPPERLQNIVRDTAVGMNASVQQLWVMRSPMVQALAVPSSRTLLFSESLLQTLSDNEIAAVCAHELAHLTETKTTYYKRYVQWLMFLPWVFIKPVVHALGLFGYLILVFATTAVPGLYRGISRKLEARADEMAAAAERDPGIYARALVRIYEDNLLPAVTERQETHPHLYDRLVAAGMTPDFPRPVAAKLTTWYGHLLAGIMGGLAVVLVIRSIGQ